MMTSRYNRRAFLEAGCIGATHASLIGTAMALGPFQPEQVTALKGSRKSIVIPTHEWAGDIQERLDFPGSWEINVMNMRGHNAVILRPEEIRQRIEKPIGTRPLREIAAGKKRVIITFDDLTRFTPTYEMAPWVVEELKAAGVADASIVFLGAFGTHRPLERDEVQKKLGKDIATRYAWVNHNVFDNVKEIGTTSFKNHIKVNQTFLAADLKICLTGVKVHPDAGYGGGAKAVLPGVASIDTVEFNHNTILRNTKTAGPVRVFKNEMRLDMIEAARLARVDFTVQVLFNSKRQVTDVFSGDIVEAHHAGVRKAVNHYCTPTLKDADIVVSNGYPVSCQPTHAQAWIGRSLRDGGTGVLILQHPLGLEPTHFLTLRNAGRDGSSYFELTDRHLNGRVPGNAGLIVYSQYMDREQMNQFPRATLFANEWEEVIKLLQQRHKGDARVAVYPYAAMQHQEIELDG